MLEIVKSSYFIKIIFSFINERKKLMVVKYNKSFQKSLNINLINYKFMSRKYIVYEEDRKGKEYDGFNDKLLFEGEYLNGRRNGKGKEYYKDKDKNVYFF